MEHQREHNEENIQKEDLAGCGTLLLAIFLVVAVLICLAPIYYFALFVLTAAVLIRLGPLLRLLSRVRVAWLLLYAALACVTVMITVGVLEFGGGLLDSPWKGVFQAFELGYYFQFF